MKCARFVCSFAILISMVLAQSNRAPVVTQRNGPPFAQEPHPAMHHSLPLMPQGAPFAQHGARAFDATGNRRRARPLQGGLNFAPAVPYGSGGQYSESVAVADVNGDGKPDLLVANDRNSTVGVLLGNGDGTFQTAVPYGSTGALAVAVADVNGDGKLDLLVGTCCGANGDSAVGVLLGNGDGTFQTAVTYDSGGVGAASVAVADVNGDGKPDILVANELDCSHNGCVIGIVGVLLGNGDGTFQAVVRYESGDGPTVSIAVADVNGDGKPDVLVASQGNGRDGTLSVLLGNGDGTFQGFRTYSSGAPSANSVAVADVNGDGKPDLLVANSCIDNENCEDGSVGVLLGNGDGTFQAAVLYDSGAFQADSVAVADVNGDGKPDLVVVNCGTSGGGACNTGVVGLLLGNGDGTFQAVVTYDAGGNTSLAVTVDDLNGDGKPDLVVANDCASDNNCNNGTASVLINTSLTPTATALTSSPNPSNFGQAVNFTATVTAQPGFDKGVPTGTVSFFDGMMNIGKSNLNNNGVATLSTSSLSVGTHNMTATYNGDSNFLPSTSRVLQQAVQGAIASFSPGNLNFGNQTVGITSSPQNVTLTNNGNINLTISLIQITGTNSGDFNQTNNCPSSLSPNTNCQIGVTFTPTATGTRNGAVSITDNAPNSPQSVPLTGVGVLPAVTFSPTSLTFPTQLVFTTSKPQLVTLTNSGAGVLKINHIGVTSPFSQTNNCPNSLGPGANCTISVKFRPGNKGVFHGAVSVTDNAPGSPQKVPLTGTGTFVQLLPAKLNFGTQPVGTRSLAKKITLTNKGSVTVNISAIAITGADAGDFAETNTCGKSVASGASCFIKVTFKPLAKGKRTGDVSVYDNGGGSPQDAMLIGTGT